MPEWLIQVFIQGGIGIAILARMQALLDNLKEDVKDMQRSKLDTAVHDVTVERIDSDIQYVRHSAANANQRVGLLEQAYHQQRPKP